MERLRGVHPDLVKVVIETSETSSINFFVIEGIRSPARQAELFAQGRTTQGAIVTRTMLSRHLTGHAVDLGITVGDKLTWEPRYYEKLADAMLQNAAKFDISIKWGGTFKNSKGTLQPDSPHFELSRAFYPDKLT